MILLSMMKNTLLYAVYEYDKTFFIEVFCVNKDRPQLNCNGHCKLVKMQQEDDEKQAGDMLAQMPTEISYFFPVKLTALTAPVLTGAATPINWPLYQNPFHPFLSASQRVKPPESILS